MLSLTGTQITDAGLEHLKGLTGLSSLYLDKTSVTRRQHDITARIVGCTADYLDINHLDMAQGRFITDDDRKQKKNVAVLAAGTADDLFQYENPVGQSVRIGDKFYSIVGVTIPRQASAAIGGSMSGQDYNLDIYIPLETMRVRMGDLNIDRTAGSSYEDALRD